MDLRCVTCGAGLPTGAARCALCGGAGEPSGEAASWGNIDLGSEPAPAPGDADLPGLPLPDLGPPPPRPRPARPAAPEAPEAPEPAEVDDPLLDAMRDAGAVPPTGYGGNELDDDDDLDPLAGGALMLDIDHSALKPKVAAPAPAAPPAPGVGARPALGKRSQALLDKVQQTEEGGYQAAPSGLFAAIPYALHVMSRRGELGVRASATRKRLRAAEAEAETALVALGESISLSPPEDLAARGLSAESAAVAAATDRAAQTDAQRQQTEAEDRAERHGVDTRIDQASRGVEPLRDKESKLVAQQQVRQHEVRRIEARMRRSEIELRNEMAAAPHADATKIEMLQSDLAARAPELALARRKLDEINEQLGDLRREIAVALGQVASLEEQKHRLDRDRARLATAQAQDVGRVRSELERALMGLASAALARDEAQALAPDRATAALAARDRVAQLEGDLTKHERAYDSWDRPTVYRGAGILGGMAALILITVIIAIVR